MKGQVARSRPGLDQSRSEPVRHSSLNSFAEAFSHWGVSPGSLQASYAMAENVFAVTQTRLGEQPARFERSGLKQRGAVATQLAFGLVDNTYVSSGPTLPGMNLRIADSEGPCGPEQPGEIQLHTECLFSGDRATMASRPRRSRRTAGIPWADYGFVSGEDLFVIGRMKDIVIVGGQNVFPEDVEAVVNSVEGNHPAESSLSGSLTIG